MGATSRPVSGGECEDDGKSQPERKGTLSENNIPAAVAAPTRSYLIDFMRGLVLLMIYVDHNDFFPLNEYTLSRFSCIDAAEVFVFISGYVCGLVYSRALFTRGFAACQKKAVRRCLQIYLAQVTLLVVCLALINVFAGRGIVLNNPDLYSIHRQPLETLLGIITLTYVPHHVGLLPLYVIFVALTPLCVYLKTRRPWILAGFSISLYLASQGGFVWRLTSFPNGNHWVFSPFAWQLLYVSGLWLGHSKAMGVSLSWRPSKGLRVAAVVGLALIALLRLAPSQPVAILLHTSVLRQAIPYTLPFAAKEAIEPLRLLNWLLLLIPFVGVDFSAWFRRGSPLGPIVVCGQSSLAAYWVGIVLNYAGLLADASHPLGFLFSCAVTLAGCVAIIGSAFLWRSVREHLRGTGEPAQPFRLASA